MLITCFHCLRRSFFKNEKSFKLEKGASNKIQIKLLHTAPSGGSTRDRVFGDVAVVKLSQTTDGRHDP